MRVAVMGSGGLGGYFGALLARGGTEVNFIARGAHLQAMRQGGLRIDGGDGPFLLNQVRATDDPNEIGPVDLVMVCVKLWDTDTALHQLQPLVGPETTLVSFQNGVLKDSYLRETYDESQLIGGVAYVAATVSEPGTIARTGPLQRLICGEFNGQPSDRVKAFHAACVASGIDAEVSSDIRREIWEKFVFLIGLSATTATMRVPIGPIRKNLLSRALLLDLMREVVAVGCAHGVPLPEDYADQRLEFADGVSPDMTSSMHHDLERGNRLEVRWLSGGVVRPVTDHGPERDPARIGRQERLGEHRECSAARARLPCKTGDLVQPFPEIEADSGGLHDRCPKGAHSNPSSLPPTSAVKQGAGH